MTTSHWDGGGRVCWQGGDQGGRQGGDQCGRQVLNLRAGKEEKEDPPYYEDLDSQLRLTSARRNILIWKITENYADAESELPQELDIWLNKEFAYVEHSIHLQEENFCPL